MVMDEIMIMFSDAGLKGRNLSKREDEFHKLRPLNPAEDWP